MIGVVVKKLGIGDLLQEDISVKVHAGPIKDRDSEIDILRMLKEDEESEIRSRKKYLYLLEQTDDLYLKRLIQFLVRREFVHQKLVSER
jgi:rubrerythrin